NGSSIGFSGVTTNQSCQAHYIKRWTVTGGTNDLAQGSTSCATGCAIDQAGSVDLIATPTDGHKLTSWSCSNGASYAALYMITVADVGSDVSCTARFDPIPL
ncbi:MAG: hypothetical protein JWN04_4018, partial [Myxococcaceae bacterium]|nr:hypothetical protein [Myxococcaceae bacterium]